MNNLIKLCLACSLLISYGMVQAQTKYSFKVTIDRYNSVKVAMPLTLEVNGARIATNGDGVFTLAVAKTTQYIKVSSVNTSKYIVLYPVDGTVFIPADPYSIQNIVIGLPDQQQTTFEAIKVLRQLDSIRKDLQAANVKNIDQVLLGKQDSLLSIVKNRYYISDADLRTAREIMEGRDQYFPLITYSLKSYLNEAKDLKDAFRDIAGFALNNAKAFKLLDSTIGVYSRAYDSLNNNNANYEQAIRNFWLSNELALGYHNIIDFALNDTHRQYILLLNNDVIKNINAYFAEHNTKKKNSLRQSVVDRISFLVPYLDNQLNILDTKINSFVATMQSMKSDNRPSLTLNP